MNLIVPPLPYRMGDLEPYVSRRTLVAHYGRQHVGYVEAARKLVENTALEAARIEYIVQRSAGHSDRQLFTAAAQAWNHTFYWSSMDPHGGGEASGAVAELIDASFGSQAAFRSQIITVASEHLGSGWAWLVLEGGRLQIITTANADTTLCSAVVPLLAIDLWEHAYYFDYQHRRADYLNAFMTHLVNWTFANANLAAVQERRGQRPCWEGPSRVVADEILIAAGAHR